MTRQFKPGDRVRMTGSSWGSPGSWSEDYIGKTLTLSHVQHTTGSTTYVAFEEDGASWANWALVPGWEIELVDEDDETSDLLHFPDSVPTTRQRAYLNRAYAEWQSSREEFSDYDESESAYELIHELMTYAGISEA